MVSITLFKCTCAGFVLYFFMIILKLWCNFCFTDYVRNLVLVGKGAIRFFIKLHVTASVFFSVITSLLCILIIYLIFAMQLWLIFTLFLLNVLWYLWLFAKCFWIKRRKYLPMLLETFFEKDGLNKMMFLLRFLGDLLLFSCSLFGALYCSLYSYPDWFKIFWWC